MSDKPPAFKKKAVKKTKKKSGTSSPKTPKSHTSEPSSPRLDPDFVPRLPLSSKICAMHKKELKLYSDTNEALICEDCAMMPNFTRYPSKNIGVDEAFRVRLSGLYNILNNYVLPKQGQLKGQKGKVEGCLADLKNNKGQIEKDMKGEFSAMNERLNFSYGTKQAVLQHDLKELQLDLDRAEHIINIVEGSASDQISFLQRSADLRNLIDLVLSKPFRVTIDVDANDMPKELVKVREIASDFEALKNLINIKDELIWKLIHEKPSQRDINESAQRELAEWARLTEKYTQELRKFQINCEYCGCALNEENVNSNCHKNLRGESRGPVQRLQGTGRHYFTDQPRPSFRSSSPATKESDISIKDLARIVKQKSIPLQRLFLQEDVNRAGSVQTKDFSDIISSTLELTKSQIADLASKFDKKKLGLVKYSKFVKQICEEIIKENVKSLLDAFRYSDEELEGVVSADIFLKILADFGVVLENPKILKFVEIDDDGNIEYLSFINDLVRKKR